MRILKLKKENIISLIGIPVIGIIMPLVFYNESDTKGLFIWIIISVFMTFVFWKISTKVVSYIWQKYPFEKHIIKHLTANVLYLLLLSIFLIGLIYLINLIFLKIQDNYIHEMRGVHFSIILVSFFTTTIYEVFFIFQKWKDTIIISTKLEKENIQAQLDVLKNQLNPHFLFNSLSTLSALIPTEPEKAVTFVSKLSNIFRYSLEFRDENIVKINEEFNFIKSYIFLQKIRYGNNLKITDNLKENILEKYVLPFSVQILIENAIKHNEISEQYPLFVEIKNTEKYIIVENNLQLIDNDEISFNIGLENITERYGLITDLKPKFTKNDTKFKGEIPILDI